jgi:hypothetical protein
LGSLVWVGFLGRWDSLLLELDNVLLQMPFQLRCGWSSVLVLIFGFIRKEIEVDERLDMLFVSGLRDEGKTLIKKELFGLLDSLLQKLGGNRTIIDIEESYVIKSDLMKKNDELHEVGVGLLPEGFLALAEQVV